MAKKISRSNFLLGSGLLMVSLIVLTERVFLFLHSGLLNSYEKVILEPVFVWLIAIFSSTVFLYFVHDSEFSLWFKRIFSWYVPIGLVLTFLTSPNLSYAFPDRLGIATLFGWGLVILTAGFVLFKLALQWKTKNKF